MHAFLTNNGTAGFNSFLIRHVERPLLNFKDNWIPPSPDTLNNRLARCMEACVNMPGGDVALLIIRDALKKGGNPDLTVPKEDDTGRTHGNVEPLIVKAARYRMFFLVQTLAAAGADIDARDSLGNTALMAGARAGCLETVSFLADRGADITAQNVAGHTARRRAENMGFCGVAKYLKRLEEFNKAAASKQPANDASPKHAPVPAPKMKTPDCP